MNRIAAGYGDRVGFLVVYTTEAHPIDAPSPLSGEPWDPWVNRVAGVRVPKARHWQDRREAAQQARRSLGLQIPVLLDLMNDAAWQRYGRTAVWPT